MTRAVTFTSVVAMIVVGVAEVTPAVAAVEPLAPVIITEAEAVSPAAPSALAVVDVSVRNEGELVAGSPLTLTLTAPNGVAIERIGSSDSDVTWECASDLPAAPCELHDSATGAPIALEDFDAADARITLALAADVVVDAGLAIGVAAAVPAVGGVVPDLSLASTTVTLSPPPASQQLSIVVDDDLPAELLRATTSTSTTTIRNLGPARLGGSRSPVVVTGPVPPGSTDATTTSPGWSCRTRRELTDCSWEGAEIPVGGSVPPLAVTSTAPPDAIAVDELLVWTREVSATPAGRGEPTVVSSQQSISVGLPGQPDVSLSASLVSPAVFEAPTSFELELTVTGRNLLDPENTVYAVADVPTGFIFSSVDSTDPWGCSQDGSLVQCTRSADFGGASSSALTLRLDVAAGVAIGPAQLGLYAAVPGEPDDLQSDNGAQIDVQVVERPAAATLLRLFSYPAGGPAEPTDGSPYPLLVDAPTSIGLDAVNNGSSPIPSGTELALALELPVGTTVSASTDAGTADWKCSTELIAGAPVLECTLTTTTATALDAELPRLKADVTATSAALAGPTLIAASLTGTESGVTRPALASSIDIDAVVVQPDTDAPASLTFTTTVGATPRVDGRSGNFTVNVANDTETEAPGVSVGVSLPQGLILAEPIPADCRAGREVNLLGLHLLCPRSVPIPPGGSAAPIDVTVRADDRASNPSTVDVTFTPAALPVDTVSVPFDLTVLPALEAVATATPSSVVGQPFGLPQQTVLLDGRSSVTLGADVAWRQTPEVGEPIVAFDGVDPGATSVDAPTASFAAPIVTEPTILHFEFSVSDGVTTSIATVAVDVAPIPVVPPGGETGWETDSSAPPPGPAGFTAFAAAALAPGDADWVWTTDPSVSPNDLGDGSANPVRGSRIRLLDNGVIVWNRAADPEPTDVIISHQFFECDLNDPTDCTEFSPLSTTVPDEAIPDRNNFDAVLRMTVGGLVNGVAVETVQEFALGVIDVSYGTPTVLVAPSISGIADVGQVLTADPGEWSLEFEKAYEWLQCAAPAPSPTDGAESCTVIPGADQQTYSLTAADVGTYIRAQVTAFGLEGARGLALSSSTAVVTDNGTGWVWTVAPTVQLNDLDDPSYPGPIDPSRMRVLDHGTVAWTGTSIPPSEVVVSHQWLACNDPTPSPSNCVPVTPETTVLPDALIPRVEDQVAGLRMFARADVDGATIESSSDFTLGPIDDARRLSLTPVALVAPSIDGTEKIGQVLTADPGEWTLEFGASFEWLRCTEPAALPTDDASSCSPIAGAVDATYSVTPVDADTHLRVRVEVSGGESGVGRAYSAGTIAIPSDDPGVPIEVTTDLAGGVASIPNAGQLTITGSATGGQPPIVLQWTQTGGTPVLTAPIDGAELTFTAPATGTGDLEFTLTATDQALDSATAVVTVTYGAVAVPGVLCEVLNAAESATGPVTVGLSDNPTIELNFADATISSPGGCSETTQLTMTGASLNLFDWMLVEDLQVDIDVDGVEVTGGMLTFPGDATLSAMDFRVLADGLSIPFELDSADLQVGGSVIADSLPFVTLPTEWDAGAKVSLESAGGVQTIGFEAIAWDTDDGAAATSPDALPVPPLGAATLALNGSASTDRTFSFGISSTNLVAFGESGLDFAGSISRTTGSGPAVIAASAALSAPATLAAGVTLDGATLDWDGERFTGSGALRIASNEGSLALTADFDFADPKDFSASLTLATGSETPSWTPVTGLTITEPQVVATLTRQGPSTAIDLTVSAARVDIGADVALIGPTFELDVVCNPSCQPPAFSLTGDVSVDVGTPTTVAFTGSLDLATGAFVIDASIANLTPFDGLTLDSLALRVTGGEGAPLSILLTADATVLSVQTTVTISLDDQGYFVAIALGAWNPGSGSPTFNGAQVVYSSYATSVDVGGRSVPVPATTILVTGTTSAPTWFTDLIDTNIGQLTVVGSIDVTTADFSVELSFDLPSTELLSVGGVAVDIDDVAFLVERTGGSITTGLTSNGTLTVPNSSGSGSSVLPVVFGAAFGSTQVLTGSVTVLGDWTDAFGVADLTVKNLTVQVSISLVGAGGSFGFAGAVILPPAWADDIGIVAGTSVKLVASVGSADPCFGIEVGNSGSTATVLDVADAGAVTAEYLSIVVAPTGCRVGLEQLPPGLSLYFDGAVLGVDVLVTASVTPAPSFSVSADITIGTVQVSGFTLDGAHIAIDVTPVKRAVEFEASASIFGVTADVAGAFSKTVTGTRASFAGVVATPDLGGFRLDELAVDFDFVQSGPTRTLAASASASVEVLGEPQLVSFSFVSANGKIVEATGDAAINIPISDLEIDGTGSFRFVAGQFPEISITGEVTAKGRTLTAMRGSLTGGGLTLSATLGGDSGFSRSPTLSGAVAWQSDGTSTITLVDRSGVPRTAQPGDFRFDARNIGLDVSGFGLNVDVTIGKVATNVWAEFDSSITLGAAGGIAVSGSFEADGDFSLTGSAALSLGGFTLPSGEIEVSKAGQTLSVGGDITYSVPKLSSVRFRGEFIRNPNVGLLYDLSGSAVVRPGGYDFGSGSFHLYRRLNGTTGLNADVVVRVPGLVAGAASVVVTPTQLSFSVNLRMQGEIGAVLGRPVASVSYMNGPQRVPVIRFPFRVVYVTVDVDILRFSVTARNVLKIPGSVAVSGSISGSDYYSVTVSATAGPYSKSKKIGICKAKVSASGTFDGTIAGTANSLNIGIDADLRGSAKCGSLKAGIKTDVTFGYVASAQFSIKVRIILNFGSGIKWKPTVLNA